MTHKTPRRLAALALGSAALAQAQAAPLTVSPDQRYLTEADGRPFFYLADTAWELFHKLNREEADYYLQNRAKKGFTVIQAVILAELNGIRRPNAYGDLPLIEEDPTRPNGAYFEHVDYIVEKAKDLGLHMALLPTWGDKVESSRPGAGPVIFTPENAAAYGEFLGKRYAGQDVLWVIGGDRAVETDEARAVWIAMARGLKEGGDGTHLVSFHPEGGASSAKYFHHEDWLDFNMYQSGHNHHYMPVYDFAERHITLDPRKPFVEGEPAYEDIPLSFWEYMEWDKYPGGVSPELLDEDGLLLDPEQFGAGFFTDYDVRIHGYWNVLAGAAGYAYGHNAVWQMRQLGQAAPIPTMTDWKGALDRPGAQDMRHLADIFHSRPFNRLRPAQEMIEGANPEGEDHIRAARATDGSFALIYLAKGQPVTLRLADFAAGQVVAWWFDPREGSSSRIGQFEAAGTRVFTPPSSGQGQDWLLVLDAEGAFSTEPGRTAPERAG